MASDDNVMRILISFKYDSPPTLKPLQSVPVALRTAAERFREGALSGANLASAAIEAMFERDFTDDGKHWSIDGSTITLQQDGGFMCSASATWDWKDIYSVAKSSATIYVDPNELRVSNYSYYVSG